MDALMMRGYDNVTVVGAGLLGHAIGLVHAMGGCTVTLNDISDEKLAWAKSRLDTLTDELCDLGLFPGNDKAQVLSRVHYDSDLPSAVANADLVVEAIVEDASAKAALYRQLASLMAVDATLASNTSFLDIFAFVPEALSMRTLIVHWYTPPYLIDLVDVVPAEKTPAAATARMMNFLKGIGKKPVRLKKFMPGYVANNVQMAIESEVFRLLDEGVADAADIDDAIRFGLAQRLCLMGQFKKIDYTGLQVVRDIHAAGLYTPPTNPTGTRQLDINIEAGATGVVSGRGFYVYHDASPDTYVRRRDRKLAKLRIALRDDDGPL